MQVYPGRGLGFLTLDASLHDVLTRLKAQPEAFPTIDVSYSPSEPLVQPVIVNLPPNGFRLRFDGPDQRLRLIEVLDFTKTLLSYEDTDLVKVGEKPSSIGAQAPAGPTGPMFRHVYDRLFGPTFPGEYTQPQQSSNSGEGVYVLSYPGIAFNFPLHEKAWAPEKDFVSLLSSNAVAAASMAIFEGRSWQEARQNLMIRPCTNPRSLALSSRGKEYCPDEIEIVKIRGNGKLDLVRRNTPLFQIFLGQTTPQDLVAELGPPDAIHRKYDRRLSIHKNQHRRQRTRRTFSGNFTTYYEDTTDTDQSSTNTITDESDEGEEPQAIHNTGSSVSAECFYNYFHHGFDVFVSYPATPSPAIPSGEALQEEHVDEGSTARLVATKILLHANVPGSYPFNRYRRSRWIIDAQDPEHDVTLNSETPFTALSSSLQRIWRHTLADGSYKDSAQKAMILNRDWGDSPGSSCEILGNWEENADSQKRGAQDPNVNGGPGFGNTKLYGFPGLLVEVLKSDAGMKGIQIPLKKTLHLPRSAFPPRAQPHDRSKYIKRCTDDLYTWQRNRSISQTFILHDGPPYANGELHIGHALNKILKDIICRSRLPSHRIDWRPGWDCHGLPIELKAIQKQGEVASRNAVSIREAARQLAAKTVQDQKESFQQWGIMADWDNPWTTMDKKFEIKQLEVFKAMAGRGLVYRRFKPVYWSPSSKTALAEAELEHRDDHVSTAAFIKYPLASPSEGLMTECKNASERLNAVIWTTTPWTLPANKAIGIHEDIEYTVARSAAHGQLLIASSRLSTLEHYLNGSLDTVATVDGIDLLGSTYADPTFDESSQTRPFLHASFVSETSGSGLVHLAPGHGMEDYELCSTHGIMAFAPIDDNGCFTSLAYPDKPEYLLGKEVLGLGNQAVLSRLYDNGQLLSEHQHTHSYPYDWRSRQPVIVRATEQWFANVGDIQSNALEALESVHFVPAASKSRLQSFIKHRSEWCISRQRAWGVPIPALYHRETNEALLTTASISHIVSLIKQRGIDAWWTDEEDDPAWTPHELRTGDGQSLYRRGKDTMDVWFDSGTSWTQTKHQKEVDCHVADCYIEGTDQHRGWFQSSLLTHVASHENVLRDEATAAAPFRTLITHGFTLDRDGRKMSKSVGNVISPTEIMDGTLLPTAKRKVNGRLIDVRDALGPDALRLWVASSDYTKDVKVSQTVLQGINGSLSKYRVTIKLMLGLLEDFNPNSHALPENLGLVHQMALLRLKTVNAQVQAFYQSFEFSRAVKEINAYIINDLSACYFEWIKDAAYCGNTDEHLQVQGTLYQIYCHLLQLLAPITPLLIEEAWDYTPSQIKGEEKLPPAHFTRTQPAPDLPRSRQLEQDIPALMKALAAVKSTLEIVRLSEKIGSSLDAYACFETQSTKVLDLFDRYGVHQLQPFFGVSNFHYLSNAADLPELHRAKWSHSGKLEILGAEVQVHLYQPQLAKCDRCWKHIAPMVEVGEQALCGRCDSVLEEMRKETPETFAL